MGEKFYKSLLNAISIVNHRNFKFDMVATCKRKYMLRFFFKSKFRKGKLNKFLNYDLCSRKGTRNWKFFK